MMMAREEIPRYVGSCCKNGQLMQECWVLNTITTLGPNIFLHPSPPLPHLFYNCLLIPDISMGYYHSKNQDIRIALVHYDQGLQPKKTNGYFEAISKKV